MVVCPIQLTVASIVWHLVYYIPIQNPHRVKVTYIYPGWAKPKTRTLVLLLLHQNRVCMSTYKVQCWHGVKIHVYVCK